MNAGLVGGIAGGIIGLIGGIAGTCISIRNTKSGPERSFMIKAAAVCWIAVIVFLVLMFVLPDPYRYYLWIPYSILLPLGIRYGNRVQQRIRQRRFETGEAHTHL